MTRNETPAGRLAREWPELDARELKALLCENARREYGKDWPDTGLQAITYRAEDAAGIAWAKRQPVPVATFERTLPGLVWSFHYLAALP